MIKLRAVLEMFTKGTDKARKETQQINDQLDQAADNAARMNRTLSQTQTGRGAMGRAGVQDTRDYRTQRSVTGSRGAEGRNFAGLAQGGGGDGFVAAYATLAANIFAVTAAFQALSNAAKTEQLAAGLDLVGARAGVALGITAKGLQQVTGFGITAADAMRTVAQATAAGFSGDEIEALGKVAKGASVALGRDLGDSMDRLVKGTVKLEPELLDELGIMTRLDDAVKQYADANGKAVSALTQTERRQAFLNAVLAEGENKFGDIADQVEVNPYDQLAASVKDLGTVFLTFTNDILGPFIKLLTEIPVLGAALGFGVISQTISKVSPSFTQSAARLDERAGGLAFAADARLTDARELEAQLQGVTNAKERAKIQNQINRLLRDAITAEAGANELVKSRARLLLFEEDLRSKNLATAIKDAAVREADNIAEQQGIVNKGKAVGSALANAGRGLMAGLGAIAFWATLIATVVTGAIALYKFLFPPSELDKKLDDSKKKMKEMADQAKQTADQVQLMLEPGKNQAGATFDAITTSIKAANAELDKFLKLQQQQKEEKNVETYFEGSEGESLRYVGQKAVSKVDEEFKTRLKASGADDAQADLLLQNYKLLLSNLGAQERINKLRSTTPAQLQAEFQGIAAINIEFRDLEENAKNIRKLTRDLVPKEPENAMRDLAEEFNNVYKFSEAASKVTNEFLSDLAVRGIAQNATKLQPELKEILNILDAQGISIQNSVSYMADLKGISEANLLLAEATRDGDPKAIAAAKAQVVAAEDSYKANLKTNKEVERQLSIELQIAAVKEDILTRNNQNLKLAEKLARLEGSNAKSLLEYNKAIQDAQFLATGADVSIPEEFSYEYNKRIADLEYENATKIASIRKQSVDIELALEKIKIDNQRAILLKQTAALRFAEQSLGFSNPIFNEEGKLKSYTEIQAILRSINNEEDRNILISRYQLAILDEQSAYLDKISVQEKASIDAETSKAKAVKTTAEARLEASQKEANINIRNIKYIDEQLKAETKINKAKTAYLDGLSNQSQVLGDFSHILNLEILPGLGSQLGILTNQISLQKDALAVAEEQGKPDRIQLEQQKLNLLKQQKDELAEQVQSVLDQAGAYEIAYSTQNSLLKDSEIITRQMLTAESIRLDIADKNLEAARKELQLRNQLKDAALATQRAEASATAAREGRPITVREEREFEKTAIQNQLDSIQGFTSLDNKYVKGEIDLLADKKQNEIDKINLEAEILKIRMAASTLELETAIANAKTANAEAIKRGEAPPISEASIAAGQSALDSITSGKLNELMNNNLTTALNAIETTYGLELGVLNEKVKTLQAELKGILTTEERAEAIKTSSRNSLGATLGGVGLTGDAKTFYEEERAGYLSDKSLTENPELLKQKLATLREMSNEIQNQQILTEGLSNVFNNLASGIEGAFMSIIDGSKSAGEAFGQMAAQIIKDIAAMIIKMLVFKAIEAGLNFLSLGSGTAASTATHAASAGSNIRPRANGGLIALANGGIMDASGGLQGIVSKPTYLVGEGRYNEAVVPLPNGRAIPVQMHGGGSQSNNVAVNVNISNSGQVQTETQGQDMGNLGQAIAVAVQKELIAQKMPGGILNRYGAA